MKTVDVKVKKISKTATLPTYGTEYSACMDLYADLIGSGYEDGEVLIGPHETIKIGTGLAFQPPEGYCALIYARSGLATKNGLAPANCVGVADCDYRGEYIVALHNNSRIGCIVHQGDRIAQIMFIPYNQVSLTECDELDDTQRGDGGFGSTGK